MVSSNINPTNQPAKESSDPVTNPTVKPCPQTRSTYIVTCSSNGRSLCIKTSAHSQSFDLYLTKCKKCCMQYVSQNPLHVCFQQHLRDVYSLNTLPPSYALPDYKPSSQVSMTPHHRSQRKLSSHVPPANASSVAIKQSENTSLSTIT